MTTPLPPTDAFVDRHIGPQTEEVAHMLDVLGLRDLDGLVAAALPSSIRTPHKLSTEIGAGLGESALFARAEELAGKNTPRASYIGMGYADVRVPPVIRRNILENPGWYTQYTPYQAEIAQGRLEALLNFQTMVGDLTGLPLANSSLLDEATAAAEALAVCRAAGRGKRQAFFVDVDTHPQTIAVLHTRAEALGMDLQLGTADDLDFAAGDLCGLLLQVPSTSGRNRTCGEMRKLIERAHAANCLCVVACDLLALCLMTPPGDLGADIAIGSAQRFGVPMGFGGPHAGFMAITEKHKRLLPGRIVGVSKDAHGRNAYRLALQTREQHIRRDKATSNICTAQVLLAVMASMYAVYHGPAGLRRIAERVHGAARAFCRAVASLGYTVHSQDFFDTVAVRCADAAAGQRLCALAEAAGMNLRQLPAPSATSTVLVSVAFDETIEPEALLALLRVFAEARTAVAADVADVAIEPVTAGSNDLGQGWARDSLYLQHPVFNRYHSETEMLRYMHRLESKDLSLNCAMIPLGSCTMKLNATTEMLPTTLAGFSRMHPFAPRDQATGYHEMFAELRQMICAITGFAAVSLQPNAGSQGEYAGLLAIRRYHRERGQEGRNVCLIPQSAHGTNPASAVMAGMKVVPVGCDACGNIDVADLRSKAEAHKDDLAALMITYPSTHGVFEESIHEVCAVIHDCGGQVYMDGANLTAMVGLARPAELGADVCHLNLHKTFAIPHGGGGPGMGPIAVAPHLAGHLPGHPLMDAEDLPANPLGTIAAAPYGSSSILPISWAYMKLLGGEGLTRATQVAILSANYMRKRLQQHYQVLFTGPSGFVAHEFIIDLRPFKDNAGISVDDVAKRLMDYGFHAPTMSWPVAGTMMIEPTESESLAEVDRFCDAMIAIRGEIDRIAAGEWPRDNNPLVHAPHTAEDIAVDDDAWRRPYGRALAAYPTAAQRAFKYWPPVSRVDNAYGDRNLVCTCVWPAAEES